MQHPQMGQIRGCPSWWAGASLVATMLSVSGCGTPTAQARPVPVAPPPVSTAAPTASAPPTSPAAQTASAAPGTAAPSPVASGEAGVDATVARATIPVIIDGDGKEWQGIAAVPAPYAKLKAGSLHLAWREDGIYGYARVKDASIDVDEVAPWKADTIELWIDQTGTRPPEMDDCVQLEISPNPQAGPGPCAVMVTQGQMDAHAIKSAWVQTADGYAIEFFIPAGQLAPAKMQPGTKIGFNYAIDLKGKAIEEFHADKDTREAYHTPSEWGVIALLP